MKENQFVRNKRYLKVISCFKGSFVGCLTITSLLFLSGCATQATSTNSATKPVAIAPADESVPTMPVAIAALVIEPEIETPKEPVPEPEMGSVASVLKKMESSPYTLYWRGTDTYSYYVGGLFDAEYKPGVGLVVKDDLPDETSLTCKYDGSGSLGDAGKDQKMKEACSKLMFTLDSELSD